MTSFPSAGLASTVAAHYMVQSLKLTRIGTFDAPDAAPVAVIQNGQVNPPIRAYGRADLAMVLSEFPPTPSTAGPIAAAILEGAERRKARMIICFEGVVPHPTDAVEAPSPGSEHPAESVWVVSSRADATLGAAWKAAGALGLDDGVIGGVTAALLVSGIGGTIPVSALLVSAHSTEGLPDHRAGAALIETLDRFLPELTMDTAPLRSQAEMIERALRQALKRGPKPEERHPQPAEPNIYS